MSLPLRLLYHHASTKADFNERALIEAWAGSITKMEIQLLPRSCGSILWQNDSSPHFYTYVPPHPLSTIPTNHFLYLANGRTMQTAAGGEYILNFRQK